MKLFYVFTKKKFSNYLIIGLINTLFGYFAGVFFFIVFENKFNLTTIVLFSSLLSIFFSFYMYKIFYFKTGYNFFFNELIKSYVSYIFIIAFSIILINFLVKILSINFFLSQLISNICIIVLSIYMQFFFIFKKKNNFK
jgi:hypothetical protein